LNSLLQVGVFAWRFRSLLQFCRFSSSFRFNPPQSASQSTHQPATAHPFKEFEMELLIGFVTTLCISLLIFRK